MEVIKPDRILSEEDIIDFIACLLDMSKGNTFQLPTDKGIVTLATTGNDYRIKKAIYDPLNHWERRYNFELFYNQDKENGEI